MGPQQGCAGVLRFITLWLFYPGFCVWTVIGTIWFSNITWSCLPKGFGPGFVIFFLCMSYLWCLIFIIFLVIVIQMEFMRLRLWRDQQLLDGDDAQRRWGDGILNFGERFLIPGTRNYLRPDEVNQLPLIHLQNPHDELLSDTEAQCSICLMSFQLQDELRQLPSCSHLFHKGCVDSWLLRSNTCPQCRRVVKPPTTSTSEPLLSTRVASARVVPEQDRELPV
eukprot:Platyproteum_vivax@DN14220_c0_g1_i1.p1